MTISFARHQFPPAIIRHAVWLYMRFTLSSGPQSSRPSHRDATAMLAAGVLLASFPSTALLSCASACVFTVFGLGRLPQPARTLEKRALSRVPSSIHPSGTPITWSIRSHTVSIKTHQSRVCSSLTESRKSAAIPTGKGRFAGRKCPAERTQNRSDGIGAGRNDESPAIARSSITVELHPSVIEIRLLGGRDLQ